MTFLLAIAALGVMPAGSGARDVFQTPGNGQNFGVWRITNEPWVRHWANYHNTRCWSHDGRYLCFTRDPESDVGSEVLLYDAHRDQTVRVGPGALPRWARGHNGLLYRILRREGDGWISEIISLDVDAGHRRTLARVPGEIELGETDAGDRWLYGGRLSRNRDVAGGTKKERSALRVRIGEGQPEVQDLPGVRGYQFMPNPRHPLFFTRWKGDGGDFSSSRLWYDLDGTHERIGIPMLQNAHTAWLGSGEYHLMGNGLVRGRRWDQPFPSDAHVLAAVHVGDVSPCGDSGRFATGDENIADLRSGDGWTFLRPLSQICFPTEAGDASTIYDADPKGSPDGTKVAFVTNYDLRDGVVTLVTEDTGDGASELKVACTDGFPDAGEIEVRGEVIAYSGKGPGIFSGLRRGLWGTARRPVRAGASVTPFSGRLLTDEQWARLGGPSGAMRKGVGKGDPILLRQRQTDVHVVVVRLPGSPLLRARPGRAEIILPEEHREILGFHLLLNGRRLTASPLRPGARHEATESGEYAARAVEWSGLESPPSVAARIEAGAVIDVLGDVPDDFSWTRDRWLVGGEAVEAEVARGAPGAIREIVHANDGVIHREHYEAGALVLRQDLNVEGRPIRELSFRVGALVQRQYTDREGALVSRELFDAEGFIAESIRYGAAKDRSERPPEADHWWFQRGMPVRQVKDGRVFLRQGDRWTAATRGGS